MGCGSKWPLIQNQCLFMVVAHAPAEVADELGAAARGGGERNRGAHHSRTPNSVKIDERAILIKDNKVYLSCGTGYVQQRHVRVASAYRLGLAGTSTRSPALG